MEKPIIDFSIKPIPAPGSVCFQEKPEACGFVLFGASGDLASKKIIPALARLFISKALDGSFFLVGYGRTAINDTEFRDKISGILKIAGIEKSTDSDAFIKRCYFVTGGYDDSDAFLRLKELSDRLSLVYLTGGNMVYYMATPPDVYPDIAQRLASCGSVKKHASLKPWYRVAVEKPFGRDLKSAVELNEKLLTFMDDADIYRMDHYLGKETVQNILIFRFANLIFEPVWNNQYIDHIEIIAAEEEGIGHRAGYFDRAGIIRDVMQNHMMQLVCMVGMEQPAAFDASAVGDEKANVLKSVRIAADGTGPVIGQYSGYRQEPGISPDSNAETYAAMKVFIDNHRWQGVPFYLKAGKKLYGKDTRINIVFKNVAKCMFCSAPGSQMAPNILTFSIQPEQGVTISVETKQPGPKLCVSPVGLHFNYHEITGRQLENDYDRVLLDCMLGEQTLFLRRDGMELSWGVVTPLLEEMDRNGGEFRKNNMKIYKAGSKEV